jgi:uncharacterized protein (TIGR03083 family)
METKEYLEHLRADGDRLAAAARSAPLAHIPSCPEWDMRELVCHTAGVHEWVTSIVSERVQERRPRRRSDQFPSQVDELVDVYAAGLERLIEALSETDPDVYVWNWLDRQPAPARFWFRRMAQETVIHRVDAEAGAGVVTPIDAPLAADGIDEYLHLLAGYIGNEPIEGLGSTLAFEPTDTAGSWRVSLSPTSCILDPPTSPAGTVSGKASDLYMWLLHRQNPSGEAVELAGDPEALAQWSLVRFE